MSANEFSIKNYDRLSQASAETDKKSTDPKDDLFHSVYIGGVVRRNEATGMIEQPGKLHIRGIEYNLDEVHLVITHIKKVLRNEQKDPVTSVSKTVCFSFKEPKTGPWVGTSGHTCPSNSPDRKKEPFCNPCREQIIMSGIYCNPDGRPIKNEDGKPIFIFLMGKGYRYKPVNDYISKLTSENFEPLTKNATQEDIIKEKEIINHKRFLTKVTASPEIFERQGGKQTAVNMFKFEPVLQLPDQQVFQILTIAEQILDKFNERFNWKGRVSNLSEEHKIPDGKPSPNAPKPDPSINSFDFDDIPF